jgi:hypothetical protein
MVTERANHSAISMLVYFQYYSSLQSQANMLGDTARTEAYRRAILGNAKVAFKGKRVMDLGAGQYRSWSPNQRDGENEI